MTVCLLAVDTATEICGVALIADGHIKTELVLNRGITHTRSVMAAIESVLTLSDLDVGDLDAFAVTRGPGGFTGLRIGIGTVKGLALAADKPVLGISTLELLAHQAPEDATWICPIIDARRHELYWSLYRRLGDTLEMVLPEQVGPVTDIAEKIDRPCYFIGNGVPPYRCKIENLLDPATRWADDASIGIRPSMLAKLAWQRHLKGQGENARTLTPVYLRKSDAELARKA